MARSCGPEAESNKPIAVFDTGLGSYSAVRLIHEHFPLQDIIYLADRASFPYGAKTRTELYNVVCRALQWLQKYSPSAIVVASNVPSITVLDDIAKNYPTPLIGVCPPVREALDIAGHREVAVLGAASLVNSQQFKAYVLRKAGGAADQVHAVDASRLIDLVETGDFLFNRIAAQELVTNFITHLLSERPQIGVLTLSSTHLAWLRNLIEDARTQRVLLDPLESILPRLTRHISAGCGKITYLVTENDRYPSSAFRRLLDELEISAPVSVIEIPETLPKST
jgi:glutamate racemase